MDNRENVVLVENQISHTVFGNGFSGCSSNGFTLIEICVAIIIVALGILTSMSILLPALKWAGESRKDLAVVQAVESAIAYAEAGGTFDGVNATNTVIYKNFDKYRVQFTCSAPAFGGLVPTPTYYPDVNVKVYRRVLDMSAATPTYSSVAADSIFEATVNIYIP